MYSINLKQQYVILSIAAHTGFLVEKENRIIFKLPLSHLFLRKFKFIKVATRHFGNMEAQINKIELVNG